MNDLKIVEKCLDGNLDYFGELYEKYIDKIYKFVYLKTSNKNVTEDIVSDVFLSALKNIKSFKIDSDSSFKAWIYKIAYNKIIDYYKKNEKQETCEIGDYLDMCIEKDFISDSYNKEKLIEVFNYLKSIKKEHRDIIIYRVWDDLSFKEISDITGMKVDNCKKISSRILKKINENIVYLLILMII